jgi:hypothetical protein
MRELSTQNHFGFERNSIDPRTAFEEVGGSFALPQGIDEAKEKCCREIPGKSTSESAPLFHTVKYVDTDQAC